MDTELLPQSAPSEAPVTLDDKYARFDGRVYLTGIQALVRLPLLQKRRDRAAGKNTAGFISGYRGSPLGGYDLALWSAKKHLDCARHRVPAWGQRGPRGNRSVGLADGRAVAETALRRRVWAMVWQGPRRRPLWRRAEACVLCRHAGLGGRDRVVRGRSWGAVLDAGASERSGADPFRDAGAESFDGGRAGELRARGLGDVALQRLLDRHEGADRYGGGRRLDPGGYGSFGICAAGGFRDAAGRAQFAGAQWVGAGDRGAAFRAAASGGAGFRAGEQFGSAGLGVRGAASAWHREHRQGVSGCGGGVARAGAG